MKPVAVIGYGKAGKTVLINRLLGKSFTKDSPETRTISISEDSKGGIAYIDCGGQNVHFIPAIEPVKNLNPVFVVASDIDREATRIEEVLGDWLQRKRILDPENRSQVIVTSTHCNTSSGFEKPGKVTRSKEGISSFFNVDSKSGDGIRDLKTEIHHLAKTIPDQEVTEEQFFYSNLAIQIINAAQELKKDKKRISISKQQFERILTSLQVKQKPDEVIKELEKLNLLIFDQKKERLIFPLSQNYHLHNISRNATNPVMKVTLRDTQFIMQLLAIKFGNYISDIDPDVICLSTDPEKDPHEVVIKRDYMNDYSILVTGKKDSELLAHVQREVLDFLKERNLHDISEVKVKCPCKECAKDIPNVSWVKYDFIVALKGIDPSKTVYCLNSGDSIPASDFVTFDKK